MRFTNIFTAMFLLALIFVPAKAQAIDYSEKWLSTYASAAIRHGLPPDVIEAVAEIESSHQYWRVSNKGALSVMQIMPATGMTECGLPPAVLSLPDQTAAIECGTFYLAKLLTQFKSMDLAVAAYHSGPGTVGNCRCIPVASQLHVQKFRRVLAQKRVLWARDD